LPGSEPSHRLQHSGDNRFGMSPEGRLSGAMRSVIASILPGKPPATANPWTYGHHARRRLYPQLGSGQCHERQSRTASAQVSGACHG